MAVAVDNDIAVWINGTFVAAEVDLTGDNWLAPLPSFDILADGSISNIVKFDQTVPFTGFSSGTNELILAVRNLDGGDLGGFGFRMVIETVPEPTTTALLALGLIGAGFARRRKQ